MFVHSLKKIGHEFRPVKYEYIHFYVRKIFENHLKHVLVSRIGAYFMSPVWARADHRDG